MTRKYEAVYEASVRAWLRSQPPEKAAYIIRVIEERSKDPYTGDNYVANQKQWAARVIGRVYVIKTYAMTPGQRIFYYVVDETNRMIVIKVADRDRNPYEDESS